ncbi:TetR/AcrR family transcriptional regulator [Candidatus Gracilibacteria bacterium]|nr:TetR/AcrR family transcriptional regulator [Candidatus Gracilibacteria bacterium]
MAKTREKILDVALRLFNQHGTAAVSTNHIAEELGISPGNLYYHFRNKEEIIRALFERQFAASDALFVLPADRMPTIDDLLYLVQQNYALLAEYRFIYRELIALLRRDDALRARWQDVRARGFAGFNELMRGFTQAGILHVPDDDAEITRLAEVCWLVTEFWPPSVEVSGVELDAERLQHGGELMLLILRPYLVA